MQESFNSWEKGLNREYRELSQPEGSYIDANNAIRRSNGTLFNETGTKNTAELPLGYEIIGSVVLEDEIIIFSTNNINSEIGVLDKNDLYKTILNTTELGFNTGWQIDAVAKKNFKGDRIVGFTDNGNNPPRYLNLDDIDLTDLNSNSKLFLAFNIPTIKLVGVNDSGNLPTGAYQFAARLLTGSINATGFGFISNIIPVVEESKSTGRDGYDGAPPSTPASKSISIVVENVDTNFDFIEIIAISYVGLSNQFEAHVVSRQPVSGRTSIPFTYEGINQQIRITSLSEITQEFPNYIGAKAIEQKDGYWFLSNLKAANTEVDFQKVANEVVLKYVIEPIIVPLENVQLKARLEMGNAPTGPEYGTDTGPSQSSFNDYKNELLTFEKKSYRREEVYSFAIAPVFIDGTIGRAYHIPAKERSQNIVNVVPAQIFGATFFNITLDDTAGILAGEYVRVQGISTLTQTLSLIFSVTGNTILVGDPSFGAAFTLNNPKVFLTSADPATKSLGVYYSSVEYPEGLNYPRTNNLEYPSTSNLVRHHKFPTIKQEPYFTSNGVNYTLNLMGVKVENFDKTLLGVDADKVKGYVLIRQPRTDSDKSVLTQGLAQTLDTSRTFDYADTTSVFSDFYLSPMAGKFPWYKPTIGPNIITGQPLNRGANLVAFISPETQILQKSFLGVTSIAPVLNVIGNQHVTSSKVVGTSANSKWIKMFLNYTSIYNSDPNNIIGKGLEIESSTVQYIPNAPDTGTSSGAFTPTNVPIKIFTDGSLGYLFFRMANDQKLPINIPYLNNRPEFQWYDAAGDTEAISIFDVARTGSYELGTSPNVEPAPLEFVGSTDRLIYNIYAKKLAQYGEIFDAKYMIVGYNSDSDLGLSKTFFGGDTFISKFALESSTRRYLRKTNPDGDSQEEFYGAINYVWLESEVNGNYRHTVNASGDTQGTVPYYPKSKIFVRGNGTGIQELPVTFGPNRGYNKQYSFENNLKYYFPKQLGEETVTLFPNRTIYSELSVEGEQFDANRSFLPNNYHDIPKNKGEIVDSFVFNGTFYLHTSQSLWKTYVNEKTTQATSSGEIVLGNGGLFNLLSEEVITVNGGYGGTQSQWAGCNTPFGRFFVDNIQGKVFVLTDNLNEISNPDMFKFFHDNLQEVLIDNPSVNQGWVSIYDYQYKRWLLTNTTLTLKPEYRIRFKGTWRNDPVFISTLVAGESIIWKDGKFLVFGGFV